MVRYHLFALTSIIAVIAAAATDPVCVDKRMELCPHKKFCCPAAEGAICGDEECIFESFAPPPKDKCPVRNEKWCSGGIHCCPDTVQCAQDTSGPFCDSSRTTAVTIPDSDLDDSTMSILPISVSTTPIAPTDDVTMSILPISVSTTSYSTIAPTGETSPTPNINSTGTTTTEGGSPTTTGNDAARLGRIDVMVCMAALLAGSMSVFGGF